MEGEGARRIGFRVKPPFDRVLDFWEGVTVQGGERAAPADKLANPP